MYAMCQNLEYKNALLQEIKESYCKVVYSKMAFKKSLKLERGGASV